MQYCNTCGNKTKYIEYKTFSYYYCTECKKEVPVKEVEGLPKGVVKGHESDAKKRIVGYFA